MIKTDFVRTSSSYKADKEDTYIYACLTYHCFFCNTEAVAGPVPAWISVNLADLFFYRLAYCGCTANVSLESEEVQIEHFVFYDQNGYAPYSPPQSDSSEI